MTALIPDRISDREQENKNATTREVAEHFLRCYEDEDPHVLIDKDYGSNGNFWMRGNMAYTYSEPLATFVGLNSYSNLSPMTTRNNIGSKAVLMRGSHRNGNVPLGWSVTSAKHKRLLYDRLVGPINHNEILDVPVLLNHVFKYNNDNRPTLVTDVHSCLYPLCFTDFFVPRELSLTYGLNAERLTRCHSTNLGRLFNDLITAIERYNKVKDNNPGYYHLKEADAVSDAERKISKYVGVFGCLSNHSRFIQVTCPLVSITNTILSPSEAGPVIYVTKDRISPNHPGVTDHRAEALESLGTYTNLLKCLKRALVTLIERRLGYIKTYYDNMNTGDFKELDRLQTLADDTNLSDNDLNYRLLELMVKSNVERQLETNDQHL